MSTHIEVEARERTLEITIDREEAKNALTPQMYDAMGDALALAERDSDIRVVIIRGAHGVFTAGNDLAAFTGPAPEHLAESPAFRFAFALAAFTKPIIAAVDGHAIGFGATMLLHVDLVYASERAVLRYPFVDLGLVPESGSSMLLPLRVGPLKAAELLLLGESLGARGALELGLVNAVVPARDLDALARRHADTLSSKAPSALCRARALLRHDQRERLLAAMNLEIEHFGQSLEGPETREAVQAFIERRAPDFSSFS